LGVAGFLVNYFKRDPLPDTCGCAPLPGCTPKVTLQLLIVIAEQSQILRLGPKFTGTQSDDFALEKKTPYTVACKSGVRFSAGTIIMAMVSRPTNSFFRLLKREFSPRPGYFKKRILLPHYFEFSFRQRISTR
jgi:hypothetical protein